MSHKTQNRVAIVGGARAPFAKVGSALKDVPALALATHSVNGALAKLDLDPKLVDQLVYGTVIVDPAIPHLAREVNFKSALPASVQSLTVTDNCISGTSANCRCTRCHRDGPHRSRHRRWCGFDVQSAGDVQQTSRPHLHGCSRI